MRASELPSWAVNFLSSTVLSEDGKVLTIKPDCNFDMHGSLLHLRWILEDHPIGKTPEGCKLPHKYYWDRRVFKDYKERVYIVLGKKTGDHTYAEYYAREENGIYYAGYEAVDLEDSEITHSVDKAMFDLTEDSTLYKEALEALQKKLGNEFDLEKARERYSNQQSAIAKMIARIE